MINGSKLNMGVLREMVDPNYHRGDRNIGFNVNFGENALSGLNEAQSNMVERIQQAYDAHVQNLAATLEPVKVEGQEEEIEPKAQVEIALDTEFSAYLQNKVQTAGHNVLQNPAHTAYRYVFLNPNPWIDPYAQYTIRDRNHRAVAADISHDDRELIRAIWLALNDEKFPISETYSREDAKVEFIKQLSMLGRAHNWDGSRWVWKNFKDQDGIVTRRQVEEEYDDGGYDKPSCASGVRQRLTQFVMLALQEEPNARVLNTNLMREKYREEMLAELPGKNNVFNAINQMDSKTLQELKAVLEDMVIMGDSIEDRDAKEQALLRQLQSHNTNDVTQFINQCIAYYGPIRLQQKLTEKVEYHGKNYENYGQLILHFVDKPWVVFYDQIVERINARMKTLDPKAGKTDPKPADTKAPVAANNTKDDGAIEQNVETLREQLVMLSIQMNNQGLMEQVIGADDNAVKQLAQGYRAQLPKPQAAPSATPPKAQADAEQQARQKELRLREEAANAAREAEAARVAQALREAQQAADQVNAADEALRQQAIEHAFATQNEVLAAQMMDADIEVVREVLEAIRVQTEEAARREQAEAARQAELARQQVEAARQAELARQQAEAARQAELARQQAEATRLAELARQQAEAARQAEMARQQAEAARQAELARQQAEAARQAEIVRQLAVAARQAEAARLAQAQAAARQPQPSPLLAAYTASRQVAAQPAAPAAPQVKPEYAALFVSDVAKQVLAVLNRDERVSRMFNELNLAVAQRFVNGIKQQTLTAFSSMNGATQIAFLTRFAAPAPVAANRPANPNKM